MDFIPNFAVIYDINKMILKLKLTSGSPGKCGLLYKIFTTHFEIDNWAA